jgi:hypothetical protein
VRKRKKLEEERGGASLERGGFLGVQPGSVQKKSG